MKTQLYQHNFKWEYSVVAIAALWYLITAYFSLGYYHGDEHYMIVEFAQYLLGDNEPADMAREFHEKMRPTIQPFIAAGIFKLFGFFGMKDPYLLSFILRGLTGLLSIFVIFQFTKALRDKIDTNLWKPFFIASFFIWFLAFINVRFSSETLSSLTLLMGIVLVLKEQKSKWTYLIIGVLMGLSFLFRFQIAFSVVGIFCWLIFIKKIEIKKLFLFGVGTVVSILFGVLLDSLFYGEFVVSFWNYYTVNIVQDYSSSFGLAPWYYYFFGIFRYTFFPIGILILASYIYLLIRNPKSLIIWTTLPFLVLHSFVGHKEIRFLFPLANFVPFIVFSAFSLLHFSNWSKVFKNIGKGFILIIISVNFVGLLVGSTIFPGYANVKVTQFIHSNYKGEEVTLYYFRENPYEPWVGLEMHFYKDENVKASKLISADEIGEMNQYISKTTLLVIEEDMYKGELRMKLDSLGFEIRFSSIPFYTRPFLKVYGYYWKDILWLLERKTASTK